MPTKPPRQRAEPEDAFVYRRNPLNLAIPMSDMRILVRQYGRALRIAPRRVVGGQKYRRAEGHGVRQSLCDSHVCALCPGLAYAHRAPSYPPHSSEADCEPSEKRKGYGRID